MKKKVNTDLFSFNIQSFPPSAQQEIRDFYIYLYSKYKTPKKKSINDDSDLIEKKNLKSLMKLSQKSFSEWDNAEDAIYDRL
jgi:hypothetical protein